MEKRTGEINELIGYWEGARYKTVSSIELTSSKRSDETLSSEAM